RSTTTSTTAHYPAWTSSADWSTSKNRSPSPSANNTPDRGHRGTGHLLLRGCTAVAGNGTGRVDVRRDRPLLHTRRLRQPRRARPRLPLRHRRTLGDPHPHRTGRGLRSPLPTALPDHGGRGRRLRPPQVRA